MPTDHDVACTIADREALDRIAEILTGSWSVGMLEDIAAQVTSTGRAIDSDSPAWLRH